jgi:hypothetical protein
LSGQQSLPSGVDEQLGFGGSPLETRCFTGTLRAGQSINANLNFIPALLDLCFSGFNNGLMQVRIRRPDGRLRPSSPVQLRVVNNEARWTWALPIDDPPGDYTVVATQGTLTATASLRVELLSRPNMLIVPDSGPPGTRFSIYLAGFPANRRIQIYAYHKASISGCCPGSTCLIMRCYSYRTTLSVLTNASGRGFYTLSTRTQDPERDYALVADHPTRSDDARAEFSVKK